MSILADLQVLGCLTTIAPRSISNSWHFLYEMVVAGVADGVDAVGRSGYGEDPVDVALDGLSADVQLGGDIWVRNPPGHHGEDLRFAQGQHVGQLLVKLLLGRFLWS